jgi:ABC-type branched-subunit amino acid transport system substrate-binding protein
MKKLVLIFTILVSLSACSSVESDAQKVAELTCEAKKIMLSGDMNKAQEFVQKAQKLQREFEEKYENASAEDSRKFQEAVMEAMKNCQ